MSGNKNFGSQLEPLPTLVPEPSELAEVMVEIDDDGFDSDSLEAAEYEDIEAVIGSFAPERQTVHVVTLLQPRAAVENLSISFHGAHADLPTEDERRDDDADLLGVLLENTGAILEDSEPLPEIIESVTPDLKLVERRPESWSATSGQSRRAQASTDSDAEEDVFAFDDGSAIDFVGGQTLIPEDEPMDVPGLDDEGAHGMEELLEEIDLDLGPPFPQRRLDLSRPQIFHEIDVDLLDTIDFDSAVKEALAALDVDDQAVLDQAPHPVAEVDILGLPDEALVPNGTLRSPDVSKGEHTGISRAARRQVVRSRAGRYQRDYMAA